MGFIFYGIQLPASINLIGALLGIVGLFRDFPRGEAVRGAAYNLGLPLMAIAILNYFPATSHSPVQSSYPPAGVETKPEKAQNEGNAAEALNTTGLQRAQSETEARQTEQGVIAHWSFDACNADDSSPYGNHGVIHGNPQCIGGVRGKAFRFDGVDDYILVPNTDSLNPTEELSMAAWYRPIRSFAGNGNNVILQKSYYSHTSPYYQYHLGVNGNSYGPDRIPRVQGQFGAWLAVADKPVAITTSNDFWKQGRWYCLVGIYGGQKLKLLVDGKLIGEVNSPGPLSVYPTPLAIAKAHNLNRREIDYTPGDIDEIQIYNRALSELEVQLICNRANLVGDEKRRSEAISPTEATPETAESKPAEKSDLTLGEVAALKAVDPHFARREGRTLSLRLKDGSLHKLTDREETNEDEGKSYFFQAYLRDLHSYLALVAGNEWHDYLLVDDITGAETAVWGEPVISPDRKRFVVKSMDMEAAFGSNGIQIWRDQGGRFISEYSKEYTDWGPGDIKWIDNSTIGITKNIPVQTLNRNYREAVAYLKLDHQRRWMLDDSAKDRWERMTLGSGVRLRANPDAASPVVARLPLGTLLTIDNRSAETSRIDDREGYWYEGAAPDHTRGWIFGPQTILFDEKHPEIAYREILQRRLNVSGPRKLAEELDFLMFLARVLPTLPKAEVEEMLPVLERMSSDWQSLCHHEASGALEIDIPYLLKTLKSTRRSVTKSSLEQSVLNRIEALIKRCASSATPAAESVEPSLIAPETAIRGQLSESIALANTAKVTVTEYYLSQGKFPSDNAAAGLPRPEHLIGNYITGITVKDGAIHMMFGNRADRALLGKLLSLRPAIVAANPGSPISWVCGYMPPVKGMSAQGENKTSVAAIYLPAGCRKP